MRAFPWGIQRKCTKRAFLFFIWWKTGHFIIFFDSLPCRWFSVASPTCALSGSHIPRFVPFGLTNTLHIIHLSTTCGAVTPKTWKTNGQIPLFTPECMSKWIATGFHTSGHLCRVSCRETRGWCNSCISKKQITVWTAVCSSILRRWKAFSPHLPELPLEQSGRVWTGEVKLCATTMTTVMHSSDSTQTEIGHKRYCHIWGRRIR